MQKRGGGDQEVWQRNALTFSGKLMAQAGCPIPCLVQDWGLFERRQLFIKDRHPFRGFDTDEQFCSNRPTYPHGTCYEEFFQSILQSVMPLQSARIQTLVSMMHGPISGAGMRATAERTELGFGSFKDSCAQSVCQRLAML